MLFPATTSAQRVQLRSAWQEHEHSQNEAANVRRASCGNFKSERISGSSVVWGPEVAVTTERLNDAPATGTVWPNLRSAPVQVRKPKGLEANKGKNVLTPKWNPGCIHPMIAAKYWVGSRGAFNNS